MKKVLIAGGSGMIGSLVVGHCLSSEEVSEVRSLLRRPSGTQHPKLQESLIQDFPTYDGKLDLFSGIDTAFFCIGVYTGQVSAQQFKEITLEYAVQFATHLAAQSPHATLCLLSGMGADRTEKSKTAFAKYKGMAENQIATLGLTFYSFRPAYIYPVTPRKEPNAMYAISRALYPLIKLFGEGASIQSTELAEAMFTVGMQGADQEILENKEIKEYV